MFPFMESLTDSFLGHAWRALGGDPAFLQNLSVEGSGVLRSAFAVSDLGTAVFSAAALAVAELIGTDEPTPAVSVNRALCSAWLKGSARPLGWRPTQPMDPLSGFYPTSDGRWLRMHMNYPHHAEPTLAIIAAEATRESIAAAVAASPADVIEQSILDGGGALAASRTMAEWAAHPQGRAVSAEPLVDSTATGTAPDDGWRPSPSRPLSGIRVLDVTRVVAGPAATRLLAGFGAEVLRIDPPGFEEPGGRGASAGDLTLGKRCARLDLKTDHGRATFLDLLAGADVLVHGLRPGAMDALGLGAEVRMAARPGLVEVTLDAYGFTGPWSGRRGFDSLIQTASGMALHSRDVLGLDKPVFTPVPILDFATGYLMAAAALRGLTTRITEGHGTRWRLALARTAAALIAAGQAEPEELIPEPFPGPVDPRIFVTPAGLAQRLIPPFVVGGAGLFWERPSELLGSSAPVWSGLSRTERAALVR